VIGWLVSFLPASLAVMCFALYKLWRDAPRARAGCRLAVLSSLILAVAGLGCYQGPAWALGWLMIILGLGGAMTGSVVFQLYLGETDPTGHRRHGADYLNPSG